MPHGEASYGSKESVEAGGSQQATRETQLYLEGITPSHVSVVTPFIFLGSWV